MDDVTRHESLLSIPAVDRATVREISESSGMRDVGSPAPLSPRLERVRRLQFVFVLRGRPHSKQNNGWPVLRRHPLVDPFCSWLCRAFGPSTMRHSEHLVSVLGKHRGRSRDPGQRLYPRSRPERRPHRARARSREGREAPACRKWSARRKHGCTRGQGGSLGTRTTGPHRYVRPLSE
jgi:hypothetical protein